MLLNRAILVRNIISGAIAAAIYLCIALPNGISAGTAVPVSLLIGAGTFIVAFIITQIFIWAHTHKGGQPKVSS
jgi:hypothetical protein